jgi:hypothetical protein
MTRVRRFGATVVAASMMALFGSAVAQAEPDADGAGIELSPASADFGEVLNVTYEWGPEHHSSTRTFTVTSTGGLDLSVGSPSVSGPNADQFAISRNTCTSALAPTETCEIDVTFTPFSTGARSATLEVPSDAPGEPRTALLTGTGVPKIVVTRLTAEPATFSAGPLGGVRLFPRASLTDAATGKALPLLSLGDPGRVVVFTVGGRTVCTATAMGPQGVASCQGLVPLLAVLLGGGYDAHFEGFWYGGDGGGTHYLSSDAHGPLIG